MTATLAIGPYNETERPALSADCNALFLATPDLLGTLSAPDRAAIRAVAYKGHHAFGAAEIAQLPQLGLVANYGVGYDAIDVAAATAAGVKVTNTPDVLNDDVADLAIGMWLMQGREMLHHDAWVRSGKWATDGNMPLNRKLTGGKAGIMGMGRIGRAIADRLSAFHMEIHYHARSAKQTPGWTYHADPTALAEAVDFLFVALVGGPQTTNYVNAAVLRALGPRGILINISRGSTVDETALLDALENGTIAGAGLDVFAGEPQVNPRFFALRNVVLQPHQGSGTVETRADMATLQRNNITAFLAGKPLLTPVN